MSHPLAILVVAKQPIIEQVAPGVVPILHRKGVVDARQLDAARQTHDQSLQQVLAAIEDENVSILIPDLLDEYAISTQDLVITVGGDGTALSVHHLLDDTPLLAVNSDPSRSVGHYTRCSAATFPALLASWRAGEHVIEKLARLHIVPLKGQARAVLNDCLICNSNPSSMSRYLLRSPEGEEVQASSGIWVSTASGSTGAIHSAGMPSLSGNDPALLFTIREPFQGRQRYRMLRGRQQPPQWLSVVAGVGDLAAYVDGDHAFFHVGAGEDLSIRPYPQPLQLICPPRR